MPFNSAVGYPSSLDELLADVNIKLNSLNLEAE